MHTVKLLTLLVEHHQVLVYFIIFLGIILEGEFIILCTGTLVHLGALNLPFSLVFIFIGGLCKTFFGYSIGSFIYKKWHRTKFLKHIEKHVLNIMPHFEEKPFWSIFISKFLLVNHIVIIFSGYKSIDFKKYLKAEISSTLIWAPGLLALGYFFSYTAIHISHDISRFSLVVLILIALFIILDKLVSWTYGIFEEFYNNGE